MGYELLAKGLRAAELAFAVIVTGLAGDEIAHRAPVIYRWIYMVIVSSMAVLASMIALMGLFPFSATFAHRPVDIFFSILWWAAFGMFLHTTVYCSNDIHCNFSRGVIACSFLSGLLWLASALMGIFPLRRPMGGAAEVKGSGGWFRRSQV